MTVRAQDAEELVAELRGKLAAAERERDEATAKERARCRYWLTRWDGGTTYQSIDRVLNGAPAPEAG